MAKTVGIKVSIDIKASNTFSDTVSSGNWDMIGLGWSASDPFGYASSAYQLYGSKSESNFSFTGTDEIDKELESIPGIKDSTKAIAQFNKAEKEARSCTLRSRSRTARSLSPSRRVLRTTVLQATPPARVSW